MPPRIVVIGVIALITVAAPVRADDGIPGHAIDGAADRAIIGGALGAALGLSTIPVRRDRVLWRRELFGRTDLAVRDYFSPRAAHISDAVLAAAVAAPVAYLTGPTVEDADGDRLVLYGEALAINLAVFQGVKRLVQRPRPYLYSRSPAVAQYAARQGDDAYQSFYSAHAATAFCAATAGAYLAGASTTNGRARAVAWAGGFAAAAAAANLRVRASKHFYSDVVIGGAVGIAIGYAVPALHADARPYVPGPADVGAAVVGLLAGGLVSELLPLERVPTGAVAERPRRALRALRALHSVHIGPVAVPRGAGVGVAGVL